MNDSVIHIDRAGDTDADGFQSVERQVGFRDRFSDGIDDTHQTRLCSLHPLRFLAFASDHLEIFVENDAEHLGSTEIKSAVIRRSHEWDSWG